MIEGSGSSCFAMDQVFGVHRQHSIIVSRFQLEVNYLGHVVSQDGACADPKEVDRVARCAVPENT